MSLELRAPSKISIDAAKEWHTDETTNYWTGFGRGKTGIALAQAAMEQLLERPPASMRMFMVWNESEPVGYVVFTDLDSKNRTGDLHITLSPRHQGKGIGVQVLKMAVDQGMHTGLYRITFRPLASNRRAINTGFKAGFKLEARTKYSAWTADGPQDQAQMRVVKPEWRKRKQTGDKTSS
jgi:RimJ/RimL family protein N-acetyltransferase